MDFSGRISDAEAGLTSAGFIVGMENLWIPEHGISDQEKKDEVFDVTHPPQYLAALYVFHHLFASIVKKSWVHIAASMQAGKTGVVTAVIRLMMIGANFRAIGIQPRNVFVITGMNDDAWKKQTKERLPLAFRDNVQHSKGLVKIQTALRMKAVRNDGLLRDVLVIQDESHIACGAKNQPSRIVYDTLCELCPVDKWVENNIRFVTISATDPSATIGVAERADSAIVKLMTTDLYQSPESLLGSERLHETFGVQDEPSVRKLLEFVDTTFDGKALWHIVRPKSGKAKEVVDILQRLGRQAIQWDSDNKKRAAAGAGSDDDSSVSMDDINDKLISAPAVETFIVIKNMFYAAKTLKDAHVGVLFDRLGHKDDTNLQSLIGRACGYGKSKTTHVFGSITTVRNFIEVWSKVAPTETVFNKVAPSELKRKMPGVTVSATRGGGGGSALSVTPSRRLPTGPACGGAGRADPEPVADKRKNASYDQDDYDSVWSPIFATEAELNAWQKTNGGQKTKFASFDDDARFRVCSTRGSAKIVKWEEVATMMAGKKTANVALSGLKKVGGNRFRSYVSYTDLADPSSARYCSHKVTKIR
jgi:hypothetical protein